MALLDWFLGLGGELSGSKGGVALDTALPAWAWVAVAGVAVGLGLLAYRRMPGGPAWRTLAAGLRAAAVLAVVWLLCGPQWVERRERVEPDVVVMLVDRSASLETPDADTLAALEFGSGGEAVEADAGASALPGQRTRDAALRERLAADAEALGQLAHDRRRIRWLGFGGGVFALPTGEAEPGASAAPMQIPTLPPADREATGLLPAVLATLADPENAPLAGVVVFSDGRSPEPVGPAAEAQLAAAGVTVIGVALGPGGAVPDVSVGPVAAPPRAFRGDLVPVSVEVRGLASAPVGARVRVQLVEPAGEAGSPERLLDSKELTRTELEAAGGRVRLRGRAPEPGPQRWAIRVEAVEGERNLGNNAREVSVEVLDRPLSVLYAEGPPRWEYRYLKNMLIREASVSVSVLLFSADAGFAPEGDVPIERFPVTAEELARYDVLVFGDVEPGYLSEAQERLVVERVTEGGAGVLFVGGPRHMPAAWADRPLAALLPLVDPAAVRPAVGEGFAVRTGPLAESLAVLELFEDLEGGAGATSGAAGAGVGGTDGGVLPLPPLRDAQRLGPLKPLAETLATWERLGGDVGNSGDSGDSGGREPLVVRMRAGAGQSLYTGTEGAWAWRRGVGERYPERYFLQMLRLLGRGAVRGGDGPAELSVDDPRLVRGGTTGVELRLREGGGGERLAGDEVTVSVRRLPAGSGDVGGAGDPGGAGGEAGEVGEVGEIGEVVGELVLRDSRGGGGDGPAAGGLRRLRALWTPDRPGRHRLVPTDPALVALGLQAEVEVDSDADERRDIATDHPKLAAIAAASGGRVLPLEGLASFAAAAAGDGPGALASVARIRPDDRAASLRTSPLALALVLLPLFGEWLIRRALRLA